MSLYTQDELDDLARGALEHLTGQLVVRTAEASFTSRFPRSDFELEVKGNLSLDVGRTRDGLGVLGTFKLSAVAPEADESDPDAQWSVEVKLQGLWHAREPEAVTDDQLRAFAVKVGMMTLFPYARAHVQAAVVASGWAPLTLDVLTNNAELLRSPDDPERVELDLITVQASLG